MRYFILNYLITKNLLEFVINIFPFVFFLQNPLNYFSFLKLNFKIFYFSTVLIPFCDNLSEILFFKRKNIKSNNCNFC